MKNNVYSISLRKIFSSENTALNVSFLSILGGLLCGVIIFIAYSDNFKNKISGLFVDFYSVFTDKTSIEIFSGIALYGIIYFSAMFLMGGSIFGKSVSPAITFFKAIGITVLTCSFYTEYSLKGIQYALLVFFPGKCILIAGMLILTKNCYEMSRDILYFEKREKAQLLKTYTVKSALTFFIFLFSWLIDFICIKIFSDLFDFI